MKRKLVAVLLCGILSISTLSACGSTKETDAQTTNTVEETDEEEFITTYYDDSYRDDESDCLD